MESWCRICSRSDEFRRFPLFSVADVSQEVIAKMITSCTDTLVRWGGRGCVLKSKCGHYLGVFVFSSPAMFRVGLERGRAAPADMSGLFDYAEFGVLVSEVVPPDGRKVSGDV